MTASLSGVFNTQQFTDAGLPAASYRLYTYAPSTTTLKTAYTDAAASVAHTYTSDGIGGQYIGLNARGELPAALFLASGGYDIALKTAAGATVWTRRAESVGDYDALLRTDLANSSSAAKGTAILGYLPPGTGAVGRTLQDKLRETVSAFDFMTSAQITAAKAYTFSTSHQTALQTALDSAYVLKVDLFIPAGGYLVTGLVIPGTVSGGTDDRGNGFRVFGQACGEPFVLTDTGGTVIKSVTDAPVMADILGTDPSSNGTFELDHLRLVGTSTTPVLKLQSFYGLSSVHNCSFHQNGTGDGVYIAFSATTSIYENYSMNRDLFTSVLGAARVGTAYNFPISWDAGLVTFTKNTARGFKTGFKAGGGAGTAYSATIQQCECSNYYNGVDLAGTVKAVLDDNYFEGGDQGTAVIDGGQSTSITKNVIFAGSAIAIDSSTASKTGTYIAENYIGLGAVVNAIGLKINIAGSNIGKTAASNYIAYTAGTAGVVGIQLTGNDSLLTLTGNVFDPQAAWTGAGSKKISNAISNGETGLTQVENGLQLFPKLGQGAVSLGIQAAAIVQADVVANVLTLQGGSSFIVSATGAATVTKIVGDLESGRLILFRTTTANMTFADSAYINLAGAVSFTGPGTLLLSLDRSGADNYASEICRTVF